MFGPLHVQARPLQEIPQQHVDPVSGLVHVARVFGELFLAEVLGLLGHRLRHAEERRERTLQIMADHRKKLGLFGVEKRQLPVQIVELDAEHPQPGQDDDKPEGEGAALDRRPVELPLADPVIEEHFAGGDFAGQPVIAILPVPRSVVGGRGVALGNVVGAASRDDLSVLIHEDRRAGNPVAEIGERNQVFHAEIERGDTDELAEQVHRTGNRDHEPLPGGIVVKVADHLFPRGVVLGYRLEPELLLVEVRGEAEIPDLVLRRDVDEIVNGRVVVPDDIRGIFEDGVVKTTQIENGGQFGVQPVPCIASRRRQGA